MIRPMRKFAWILLCLLVAWSPARAQYENAARHIFGLTNQDRQARGLPPLEWNAALARAAERHAALMARQGNISHQYAGEPAPMERAAQAGAHFHAVAENVAMAPTASDVETSWMHSTPHRRNILESNKTVGAPKPNLDWWRRLFVSIMVASEPSAIE